MNELINHNEIVGYIKEKYLLNVESIEKIKNSYRICTKESVYCLKTVNYEFNHFYFILSAIKHLKKNGFLSTPDIICNKYGKDYGKIGGNYIYLTKWIPSRVSNYDNPVELQNVAAKLAELHQCSKNFIIDKNMKPRIGWFSWIEVFNTRLKEIMDFKNRINQKYNKSEFDLLYLDNIENEIKRGLTSIEGLKRNNYYSIMNKEVFKSGFCHHDYAHHNVLVDDNNNLNIIDFDYCILDTHIHDISSLFIRSMKDGKWNNKKADIIKKSYDSIINIQKEEIPLIREFIRFPQTFWQIGIQVYWEQQQWGEEFFINKLQRYLNDVENREKFIDSYFAGGD